MSENEELEAAVEDALVPAQITFEESYVRILEHIEMAGAYIDQVEKGSPAQMALSNLNVAVILLNEWSRALSKQ